VGGLRLPRSNPIWLSAAILKNRYNVITPPAIDWLLRNLADRCKITCKWLSICQNRNRKQNSNMAAVRFPKPEVGFISAVDWDISSKFGRQIDFHILKQIPSPNLNTEVHFRLYGHHLEKWIWRHNSAADRSITTKFDRQMYNDMPMTTHTTKSKSEMEFQYGGRPFSETGSSFISSVDWCVSSKFGRQIDFHLEQMPSLNMNPEVHFGLYGRHLCYAMRYVMAH